MSTIDYPEPNTTVARLSLALDNCSKSEAIQKVEDFLKSRSEAPSGATFFEATGVWYPDSEDLDDEVEDQLTVEIWIDSESELKHVRDLKEVLEDLYDQHCVCLSLVDRYYEH